MNVLRQLSALLFLMPASAFATFKFCDIYQGQIMACSADVIVASHIPVYRDNAYHDCYIQAGHVIYCDTPTNASNFPVADKKGYRNCDIEDGIITACGPHSSVTRFPVAVINEEPSFWRRQLKASLCQMPTLLRPDSCDVVQLPEQITFFQRSPFTY